MQSSSKIWKRRKNKQHEADEPVVQAESSQ